MHEEGFCCFHTAYEYNRHLKSQSILKIIFLQIFTKLVQTLLQKRNPKDTKSSRIHTKCHLILQTTLLFQAATGLLKHHSLVPLCSSCFSSQKDRKNYNKKIDLSWTLLNKVFVHQSCQNETDNMMYFGFVQYKF